MKNIEPILRKLIRDVTNFPKEGILFRDITPVLGDAKAFQSVIDAFAKLEEVSSANVIAAFDARGFLFGAPLALQTRKRLALIRKKGKLPFRTIHQAYGLEYGNGVLEMHTDSIYIGDEVFIIDDLLATGGTALAGCQLVERLGGIVTGLGFVIELENLNGRSLIADYPVTSLVQYS